MQYEFQIGNHVQLEPIVEEHREPLRKTADHEQIWKYMPYKATGNSFNPWFDECLDKMRGSEQITYIVRGKSCQSILGATAFYDFRLNHKSLALGYSWYTPAVWGTVVNPEAKLLMLRMAFETWGINRIEIGADARNIHSCNAIQKLGATREGVLRQHMVLHDNVLTDTILFSILSNEWPVVKTQLINRLKVMDGI